MDTKAKIYNLRIIQSSSGKITELPQTEFGPMLQSSSLALYQLHARTCTRTDATVFNFKPRWDAAFIWRWYPLECSIYNLWCMHAYIHVCILLTDKLYVYVVLSVHYTLYTRHIFIKITIIVLFPVSPHPPQYLRSGSSLPFWLH